MMACMASDMISTDAAKASGLPPPSWASSTYSTIKTPWFQPSPEAMEGRNGAKAVSGVSTNTQARGTSVPAASAAR